MPAVDERLARDVVAAALHGERQPVLAREVDRARRRRVRRSGADDQAGLPVDHGVPDLPSFLVALGAGKEQLAFERRVDDGSLELRRGRRPGFAGSQ